MVAGAELYRSQWLLIAADEQHTQASGCSIDASVHVVRQLAERLGIDFFDRKRTAYIESDEVQVVPLHDFWAMRKAKLVHDDTQVFNSLAASLGAFRAQPFIPFADSWHAEMWR
jgi:hypothetical protein